MRYLFTPSSTESESELESPSSVSAFSSFVSIVKKLDPVCKTKYNGK